MEFLCRFPFPFIQRRRSRKNVKDGIDLIRPFPFPFINSLINSPASASTTPTTRTQLHVRSDPLIKEDEHTQICALMHVLPYLHAAKKMLRKNNKDVHKIC